MDGEEGEGEEGEGGEYGEEIEEVEKEGVEEDQTVSHMCRVVVHASTCA